MKKFTEKQEKEFEDFANRMIADEKMAPIDYRKFRKLARLKGDKELINRIIEQEKRHKKWDEEIKAREI